MSVYYDDLKTRKSIARASRSVVNGSKTKYVSLPSDGMTRAEWKRRNGDVTTYEMGKKMNWAQFKMLPADIKREYIINYGTKNRLTQKAFAEQFGVSTVTLGTHLKAVGVSVDWREIASGRSEVASNAIVADVPESRKDEAKAADVSVNQDSQKIVAIQPTALINDDRFTIGTGVVRYSGSIVMSGNSSAVFETIYKMVGDGRIKATVTWDYE